MSAAKKRHTKPVAPKTKEIVITPEQTKLVLSLQSEMAVAQQRMSLVLAGVVAGHGLGDVQVVNLDTDTNTLTVVVP